MTEQLSGLDQVRRLFRHSEMNLDHMYFEDDFLLLKSGWNRTAGGTGTAPTLGGEEGGTIVLSTGGTTGGWSLLQFNQTQFKTDLKTMLLARMKINTPSSCDAYLGFRKDADEYCYFHIDNVNIMLKSDDGGGEGPYSEDSGVNLGNNAYFYWLVELLDTETGKFFRDGTELGTPTVGAVTADLMDLYVYIINTANVDCIMTLDFIRIWQDR